MTDTAARIVWPEGKQFAFTIFDDADYDLGHNTRPVYEFLAELGLRTTKSVWTIAAPVNVPLGGVSTGEPEYLAWVQSLQRSGFEIGYHGARCISSAREITKRGLDVFREQFGHDPRTMSNHFENAESVYWGSARLSGARRLIYRAATFRRPRRTSGEVEGDAHFWGDLCRARIGYVRNFVFPEINTLAACSFMPYYDPQRPFVRAWYASTEGGDVASFCGRLREAAQEQLAAEGGASIIYTHFAKGFAEAGKLHPRFTELMRRLVTLGGWFVPVGELLDWLAQRNGGVHEITDQERARLEWRWLRGKLLRGSS